MIDNDKQIQDFFRSLKNVDRDMLVIEDFKDQMRKVQGTFSENE
jgi:hypothetical protein